MQLGEFQLEAPIGAGAMGVVWRAVHPSGALAAVKVMQARLAEDPASRGAVAREVRAVAGLDHPGVVGIYDHGTVDRAAAQASRGDLVAGSPWIALAWVDGPTADRWRPDGLAEVRGFVAHLLHALVHSHGRQLLHQDIKPANILLRAGAPVLTDFGIAAAIGQRTTWGTSAYAAPEQLDGGAVGPWTDLFQLGATLRRLVAVWGLHDAMDEALWDWIDRATEVDPWARFPSAAAALEVLGEGRSLPRPVRGLSPAPAVRAGLPLFVLRRAPVVGLDPARATAAELVRRAGEELVVVQVDGPSGSGRGAVLRELVEGLAARGGWVARVTRGPGPSDLGWALRQVVAPGGELDARFWTPRLGPALTDALLAVAAEGWTSPRAARLLALVLDALRRDRPVGVWLTPGATGGQALLAELRRLGVPALFAHAGEVGLDVTGVSTARIELAAPRPLDLAHRLEARLPLDRADALALVAQAGGHGPTAMRALEQAVAAGRVRWTGACWSVAPTHVGPGRAVDGEDLRGVALVSALAPELSAADLPGSDALVERGLLALRGSALFAVPPLAPDLWPDGIERDALALLDALEPSPTRAFLRGALLRRLGHREQANVAQLAAIREMNRVRRHDLVATHVASLLAEQEEGSEPWIRARYLQILAFGHTGALQRAITSCEALHAAGVAHGATLAIAIGATERVFWLHRAGRTAEALPAARASIPLARGTIMEASSWLYLLHVLPASAHEEAREAVTAGLAAVEYGREGQRLDLWYSDAIRLRAMGDDAAATARARQILTWPDADAGQRLRARSMLGELLRADGRLAEAEAELRMGVAEIGRDADPAVFVLMRTNLAIVLLDQGRPAQARALLLPLLDHYDPSARIAWPVVQFVLVAVAAVEGDPGEVAQRLARVEEDRDRRILHQPDSSHLLDITEAHVTDPALRARLDALRAHIESRIRGH